MPARLTTRALALVCAAAVPVGLAACGGDDPAPPAPAATAETTTSAPPTASQTAPAPEPAADPQAEAETTVENYYSALGMGDAEASCGLLTDAGKADLVKTLKETFPGEDCEEVSAQLAPFATDTKIRRVTVKGETGTARTQTGSNSPATLKLVKTADGWRIDGF